MGILSRLSDMLSANINSFLNKPLSDLRAEIKNLIGEPNKIVSTDAKEFCL